MNINELRRIVYYLDKLRLIAKSLHKLDEYACNYGLTPRQEKRLERLEKLAEDIAHEMGFKSYHQGDPRGASLYLLDKKTDENNYSSGLVIY